MPLHRKRRATQQSVKSDPPALRVAQSSPLSIVVCLRVAPATRLRRAPRQRGTLGDPDASIYPGKTLGEGQSRRCAQIGERLRFTRFLDGVHAQS